MRIEGRVRAPLPEALRTWLRALGYGDLDQALSFRYDWFQVVEYGHLSGAVIFAQDDLGNFYAYAPADGSVVVFSRSSRAYAVLAPSFMGFIEELERRDFKLGRWVDGVHLLLYDSNA